MNLTDEFNRDSINPRGEVAQTFPPEYRDRLIRAARAADLAAIDAINAELVALGWCRHRTSMALRNWGVA